MNFISLLYWMSWISRKIAIAMVIRYFLIVHPHATASSSNHIRCAHPHANKMKLLCVTQQRKKCTFSICFNWKITNYGYNKNAARIIYESHMAYSLHHTSILKFSCANEKKKQEKMLSLNCQNSMCVLYVCVWKSNKLLNFRRRCFASTGFSNASAPNSAYHKHNYISRTLCTAVVVVHQTIFCKLNLVRFSAHHYSFVCCHNGIMFYSATIYILSFEFTSTHAHTSTRMQWI